MSRKRSDTSKSVGHHRVDDFKLINGIGPAVEKRLHDVGIFTFSKLAALSPADIAAAVAGISGLTTERIINQDWIGQARRLMTGPISSEAQKEGEAPSELMESAAPHVVTKEKVPAVAVEPELAAPAAEETESIPPVVAEPEPVAPASEEAEPAPPVVAAPVTRDTEITSPVGAGPGLSGILRLRDLEMVPAHARSHQNFLPYDQPFDAHLMLDLSDVVMPGDIRLNYKLSIFSKNLEGHSRQVVSETSGIITSADRVTISITGIALPKGTYRLKAMLILNPMMTESVQQPGLVASKESDLLLIF